MTMHRTWILVGVIVIAAVIGFAFFAEQAGDLTPPSQSQECNADAKICPDGSSVGRTGPNCEFAACPSPEATSATATTFIGGQATGLNVTVNPRDIVSDSRCPQGVQCIWAGTVEVKAAVSTQVAHGEHVFKLGESRVFGDFSVTLVAVTPYPNAGEEIPISSYRFTFEIKKR